MPVFSNQPTKCVSLFRRAKTNAALLKKFPFSHREQTYAQFRFETFIVFNTPIFKNPGNTMGSSLGKITSTGGGDRQLQRCMWRPRLRKNKPRARPQPRCHPRPS